MDDLTLAIAAARHLADLTAQMHIDALWRAKTNPDEARWMLNRLAAGLRRTRAALTATHDPTWWDTATPDDIAHTYQLAHLWSRDHPDIAVMQRQLQATIEARHALR
ncbi:MULTISPECIES: hypothetical protein [unclassified Rathayibacter]|uniref:hypothetical protein n=1 Tax=unclassified Rathayibacter TaxID=2609250 RepID=UPI001FB4B2B2|nr:MULTISPECIES: hypothetical protein [unclassified Rathayibacter]MCJ1674468.1 hypothetical protein [Rathayibacter sp. VKM Ac-2929]MCJ1684749.1 hypothetical protein [Rathayibacter sp. VKM Ac-2928]